jgi:hypothetical protein
MSASGLCLSRVDAIRAGITTIGLKEVKVMAIE